MPHRRKREIPQAQKYREQAKQIRAGIERSRTINRFDDTERHHEIAKAVMRADIDDARVQQAVQELADARAANGWTERVRELLVSPKEGQ